MNVKHLRLQAHFLYPKDRLSKEPVLTHGAESTIPAMSQSDYDSKYNLATIIDSLGETVRGPLGWIVHARSGVRIL